MNADQILLTSALGAAAGLGLAAQYGRGLLQTWARGAVLWGGVLWTALALVLFGGFVSGSDTLDLDDPGKTLSGLTLFALCLGGAFSTSVLVVELLGTRLRWKPWLTQALAALAAMPGAVAGFALYAVVRWAAYEQVPFWRSEGIAGMFDAITLWLIMNGALLVGLVRMVYALRMHGIEADRARLAAENTTARLAHLEARLRPHFLYNALSGLAGLIREDPDRAETMTLALARLLRRSLDGADDAPTLPLRAEVDLVRAYLDVEQLRFGDRLRVTFDVDDAVLNAEVPRLTLQPLVENAIKHGLAKTGHPVHVGVAAAREGRRLHLAVADDGPPFPLDLTGGHGLTSVTERLRLLYDDDFSVRFVNASEGQMKHVGLTLPFQPSRPVLRP